MLSRIVEETAFSPANNFFKRLAFKGRALEERIQVGDIGSMMLAVVVFDRFGRSWPGPERQEQNQAWEVGIQSFGVSKDSFDL